MTFEETIPLLLQGKVGVWPTDTVYGVVGLLLRLDAVERIYELKKRDLGKHVGTILIASSEQIKDFVPSDVLIKAEQFWPGPVSVVLPVSEDFHYAHKGSNSLAFRVPADEALRSYLEQTGPLATSSANLQAQPPATTVQQAHDYFDERVDFYVDGGDLGHRQPSRVISIQEDGSVEEFRH